MRPQFKIPPISERPATRGRGLDASDDCDAGMRSRDSSGSGGRTHACTHGTETFKNMSVFWLRRGGDAPPPGRDVVVSLFCGFSSSPRSLWDVVPAARSHYFVSICINFCIVLCLSFCSVLCGSSVAFFSSLVCVVFWLSVRVSGLFLVVGFPVFVVDFRLFLCILHVFVCFH